MSNIDMLHLYRANSMPYTYVTMIYVSIVTILLALFIYLKNLSTRSAR